MERQSSGSVMENLKRISTQLIKTSPGSDREGSARKGVFGLMGRSREGSVREGSYGKHHPPPLTELQVPAQPPLLSSAPAPACAATATRAFPILKACKFERTWSKPLMSSVTAEAASFWNACTDCALEAGGAWRTSTELHR